MADPTPLIQGKIKTAKWGTKGATQGALSEIVLESVDFDQIVDRSKITDGDGFTVFTVTLVDGMTVKVSAIYQTDKTYPDVGGVISIKMWGHKINGVDNPVVPVEIISKGTKLSKKKEMLVTFDGELYNMFAAA